MPDLIRKENIMGRDYIIIGDGQTDIILETKSKIKVKNGNKIVEIWDGTKVVVPSTT